METRRFFIIGLVLALAVNRSDEKPDKTFIEVETFPIFDILNQGHHQADVDDTFSQMIVGNPKHHHVHISANHPYAEFDPLVKQYPKHHQLRNTLIDGPVHLNVDDRKGLLPEGAYDQPKDTVRGDVPQICSHDVPCKKINTRIQPPRLSDSILRRSIKDSSHWITSFSERHKRSLDRRARNVQCDHEVHMEAFGQNYTLCLKMKSINDDDIVKRTWNTMNVTVFGSSNASQDIPIRNLDLQLATGFVLGEDFTSVSGFLMDDHFYGTVYMKDSVHYLEPHGRKSRDMHILGKGLKTLLHKHDLEEEARFQDDDITSSDGDQDKDGEGRDRKLCDLTIVADHLFYQVIGELSLEKTVLQMLWHIREANALFQSKDFDGNGRSECIGFSVSEITIFTTPANPVNLLTGEFDIPEDFLKRFSRYNFDGFCLGVLFTNRAFNELVLGLSWRGNPKPKGVGGICQRRVRIKSDRNAYSFNALFISLRSSQEDRIPLRMGVLNLVHEMMHSFGAKHDPDLNENPKCTPTDKWVNGRYLMSKYSNDGHKLNHEILSPCTKELVLQNLGSPTRTSCLMSSVDAFCGDAVVQEGEECDCGTTFQCIASRSCCNAPEGPGTRRPCTWSTTRDNQCVQR